MPERLSACVDGMTCKHTWPDQARPTACLAACKHDLDLVAQVMAVARLAAVVLLTFVVLWAPFAVGHSPAGHQRVQLQVSNSLLNLHAPACFAD